MIRLVIRAVLFAGIVAMCLGGSVWPMRMSPFVGITALIGGTVCWPAVAGVAVLVLACLVWRRAICRFVCPMGVCFDCVRKVTKRRAPRWLARFPRLGMILALLTWLGAAAGVVGFVWLDPFVLFGTVFRLTVPLVFLFVTAVGLAWLAPGFWCRCVCPLGGVQDLVALPKTARRKIPTRRRFLRLGLTLTFGGTLFALLIHRTRAITGIPFRPPGAVDEPRFLALCTRCGQCIHACPTQLLQPETQAGSLLEIATPEAVFDHAGRWCRDDCTACATACPSGAIRPFTLEEKPHLKIGRCDVTFEHCRLYDDIECSICARDCPYEAITYVWSEEEYRRVPVVDAEKCTGCGRCLVSCPVKAETGLPLRIVTLGHGFQPKI